MDRQISKAHSIIGVSRGRPENDFYPTPREATLALLERESFDGVIWEPACGDGAISKVLDERGYSCVLSSDIVDRGFGVVQDFLDPSYGPTWIVENIITNPPYSLAEQFVRRSLAISTDKVAMLLKLQFLEGVKRRDLFRTTPLKRVYVFSKRLKMSRNGEEQKNGGMLAFAWFVWEKGYMGEPVIDWI